MKIFKTTSKFIVLISGIAVFFACSDNNYEPTAPEETSRHTIPMNFIGEVTRFNSDNTPQSINSRAETTSSWDDGDNFYISFYDGTLIIPGEATYNSSSGWSISYEGNLPTGAGLKCEVRFFVNATFSSSSLISLNQNSQIYEDLNGTYTYSNGALTVQATLSPKTGRIRFTGTPDATIYTTGISIYTTFSPGTNAFSSSKAMITSTVASNGSTPYIYGEFSDSERNIGLVGSDFAFTRTCTAEIFKKGESGYMAIPSDASHNNWRSGLYVKASGVEFKMIPVADYSGGFFLIGETEVTEALYYSVNGTSNSSLLPVSVGYSNATSFIEKLNNQTELHFSIPSYEQWKYAAQGGNKSQNYTYSGSNTPGDVAWYSANSSNSKHNVKTKAPNELGIYDMSGNVSEFAIYNSNSVLYCGGYYNSSSSGCLITSYDSSSVVGLRLILTCP